MLRPEEERFLLSAIRAYETGRALRRAQEELTRVASRGPAEANAAKARVGVLERRQREQDLDQLQTYLRLTAISLPS